MSEDSNEKKLKDFVNSANVTNISACEHCMHLFTGPIWMVVPDGHVMMKCCHCAHITTLHAGHVNHNLWKNRRAADRYGLISTR